MKVVFCVDENLRYLPLLKVAARSLHAVEGSHTRAFCVYAGTNENIIAAITAENLTHIPWRPRLNKENLPPSVWHSIGCFLKLELALMPEFAEDEKILYCDADVLFRKPISELAEMPLPPYMAMAREQTAPFFNDYSCLGYDFNGRRYNVPMPFPIWTFSSGVVLFNLKKLRSHHLVEHFLAFSRENVEKVGNLDQSLLNYYFGKKIIRLENKWNSPPYQAESLEHGHIIHFHGPKPWDTTSECLKDLRINHFDALRQVWFSYLDPEEKKLVQSWNGN